MDVCISFWHSEPPAREGRWEGIGEAGMEGGKEGKGSVLLPLDNSVPPKSGVRGGFEEGGSLEWEG